MIAFRTVPEPHKNQDFRRSQSWLTAMTISGLSKTYPNGVKALKNVSLTIGNYMFGPAWWAEQVPEKAP